MRPSTYATICALLCGTANFIVWTGYYANVYIGESVLHSVNHRAPERIGKHDGYYGLAVSNGFCMLTTIFVPSLMHHFRCKWILALSGSFFIFYYLSFQVLNRYLYFFACAVLGMAFALFNISYNGYLNEFSTRETIARNHALSWAIFCLSVFGSGAVNLLVTTLNLDETVTTVISKYREYSDTEFRYFFAAFCLLAIIGTIIFALLPNKEVEGNIAQTNVRCNTLKEQLGVMFSVLFHKRVLVLIPFYTYIGLFYSFWISILPTTLQFTKALSLDRFVPLYFGITFTAGSVIMCIFTMKMSTVVKNFSFKPLMIINFFLHVMIYSLMVCLIPKWSTVRPNGEPSLLIQPTIFPVLVLAFICGLADAANNTTRTVISSLLFPTRRQQSLATSRFYHALASTVMFYASPSLSIYAYAIIFSSFLVAATIAYLFTCHFVEQEEKKNANQMVPVRSDYLGKQIMVEETVN